MLPSIRTFLLLALFSTLAFAADVTGKWVFQVETDAGSGAPSFVFKQAGEKLTGTYTGTFGTAELNGTVKGDEIQFSIEVDVGGQKGTIVYKGKIESADKMKGTVDLSGLGSGSWTGTKQ
jgi:polyisoprenoid-binding protein YceI